MTIQQYKECLEGTLDIRDCLIVVGDKILPNKSKLTRHYVKKNSLDDLFEHRGINIVFTNRFLCLVDEITGKRLTTGRYILRSV